jgi:hypothetical protein
MRWGDRLLAVAIVAFVIWAVLSGSVGNPFGCPEGEHMFHVGSGQYAEPECVRD